MSFTKITAAGIDTTGAITTQLISVVGISTVGSLSIGATSVISSAFQLQNIASLDATTTATIESAITNAPNTFTDLNITGISTFVNGPVLIGSGTSTGTAGQVLQATGGAYVSGNLGIGTTNPSASYKLDVTGNSRFSQDIVVNSVNIGCGGITTSTVVVGAGAGTSGPGSENVFVGAGAGRSATSAAYRNTAIGFQAMYNNDIGPTNTAIGYQALYSLSGFTYYNTAVGRYALGSLTSGIGNIAMGHNSGSSVTTGASNICIGSGGPTTGSSNIMIAGAGSTAGSNNILLGGTISATTGTESYNVILGTITVAGGINNNIIIGDGQGNERLRINSSGNLGIGTTNPAAKLDVNGTISATDTITLTTKPFFRNVPTIAADYTITTNYNEMSIGPITINSGITVTVNTDATWTVI